MSNFREELKKPLRKMLMNFAPQHTVDIFLETYADEYFDQIIELVKGEIVGADEKLPERVIINNRGEETCSYLWAERNARNYQRAEQLAKLEEGK